MRDNSVWAVTVLFVGMWVPMRGALWDAVWSCPNIVLLLYVSAFCHGITEASVDWLMV